MDLPERRPDDRHTLDQHVGAVVRLYETRPQVIPIAVHPLRQRYAETRLLPELREVLVALVEPAPPAVPARLTVERARPGDGDVGAVRSRRSAVSSCRPPSLRSAPLTIARAPPASRRVRRRTGADMHGLLECKRLQPIVPGAGRRVNGWRGRTLDRLGISWILAGQRFTYPVDRKVPAHASNPSSGSRNRSWWSGCYRHRIAGGGECGP